MPDPEEMSGSPALGNGPARSDLSGRTVGDLRLLRRLGRGAMADVYLAEQERLRRQVAVKILRADLAEDPTYLQRFAREAQAAAALVHANIVQTHEVGCIDGLHYIVQEYVQGQNLRHWLARRGPPDLAHSLSVMRQVAAALAKAAEAGIVHRDIKPENIMITPSGEVKVADFGLARLHRQGEKTDLTQIGITMGTPLYMSPEQVEGKPIDPRSDLYSLGVTCYQMLSGTPPFSGQTALSVAVQHLKHEAQPLDELRSDLPPSLCRIVHRMLEKDPARRFQSPRELLQALRQVQLEELGASWPDELPGWDVGLSDAAAGSTASCGKLQTLMATEAVLQPPPSRPWRWLVAATIAFILGGAAAWVLPADEPVLGRGLPGNRLPREETALRQWYYASRMGTEEAWQSVIDYFPEETLFVRRAQQQLARIYLSERDFPRALELFEELASLPPTEAELRAFGLAGKVGVYALTARHDESAKAFADLWPIHDHLVDPQMQQMVEQAMKLNRDSLGGNLDEHWMRELFGPGG